MRSPYRSTYFVMVAVRRRIGQWNFLHLTRGKGWLDFAASTATCHTCGPHPISSVIDVSLCSILHNHLTVQTRSFPDNCATARIVASSERKGSLFFCTNTDQTINETPTLAWIRLAWNRHDL